MQGNRDAVGPTVPIHMYKHLCILVYKELMSQEIKNHNDLPPPGATEGKEAGY